MSEKKEVVKSKDLIEKVSEGYGLNKKQSKEVIELVSNSIADALKNGKVYDFAGIGKFEVKERAARQGRNPLTGETVQIAASKKVRFRPCKALKELVK